MNRAAFIFLGDNILLVHEKTLKYIEENPKATEHQINKYLVKVSKQLYLQKHKNNRDNDEISIEWYDGYSEKYLNEDEKELYDENPRNGNQSLVWGKEEAYDYTTYKFGRNGHIDRSDELNTIRHHLR
jgi:hypothetical protein